MFMTECSQAHMSTVARTANMHADIHNLLAIL